MSVIIFVNHTNKLNFKKKLKKIEIKKNNNIIKL